MDDNKLDRILKQALSPEVNDDEIKIKFEQEERVMRNKKRFARPAAVLAACAVLAVGIGFGNLPEQIVSKTQLSQKTGASTGGTVEQSAGNGFVMKVKAAEIKEKELKKGKSEAVVYMGDSDSQSESWSGSPENNKVSYCVTMPLVCEGEDIDKITYSVDKGCFRILQPQNDPYVIDGEECDAPAQVSDSVGVDFLPEGLENMEEKYYKSYTISAKDQNRKDVMVYLCDGKTLSGDLYKRLWESDCGVTEKELAAEAAAKNEVMEKPQITCRIKYQDSVKRKSETAKVAVQHKVMTYEAAGSQGVCGKVKNKMKSSKDAKGIFVTFERL